MSQARDKKRRDEGSKPPAADGQATPVEAGDQGGGWTAIDPGFALQTPDAEAIDRRFRARVGDPAKIDPRFLIRPPKRRSR